MPAELAELVARGDMEGVAHWCVERGLPALQAMGPELAAWADEVDRATRHGGGERGRHQAAAAVLVGVAACQGVEPAARMLDGAVFGWSLWSDERMNRAAVTALGGLRPPWLPALADRLTRNEYQPQWRLGRALVVVGLCDKPTDPGYLDQMTRANGPIATTLRADPGLIADVWRIFEGEAPGTFRGSALALDDGFVPAFQRGWPNEDRYWSTALVHLARDGTIDRSELIDRALAALRRNASWPALRWFSLLLEELDLSADEEAERAGRYASLLAAPNPQVVGLAQPMCERLLANGVLRPDEVLPHADAAFFHPTKTLATAQLRLLGSIGADLAWRDGAAACVGPALAHTRADVQAAALAVVGRWWPDLTSATRDGLSAQAEALAPSHRARWDAIVAGAGPTARGGGRSGRERSGRAEPKGATAERPPAATPPGPGWTPPVPPPVPPALDDDGLVLGLAAMLERTAPPMVVERVIEATLRICDQPLARRRGLLAPVAARARKSRWFFGLLDSWAAACVAALVGEEVEPLRTYGDPMLAIDLLNEVLADVAAGVSRPWTIVPDRGDGRISPGRPVPVAGVGPAERLVARLRADEGRTALRLGPVAWETVPARVGSIYTCSLPCRLEGEDGSDPFDYVALPTYWAARPGDSAWVLSLTPHHPELAVARPAVAITELCEKEAAFGSPPLVTDLLERLAWVDQQPGELAPLVVALALGAKPAPTRLMAVDAARSLLVTKRLAADDLGGAGARLGPDLFKLGRVARALRDLLDQDPPTARDLAVAILAADPKVRDAHAVATVLCDAVGLAGPVALPGPLLDVARDVGRTKLQTELRRVLGDA